DLGAACGKTHRERQRKRERSLRSNRVLLREMPLHRQRGPLRPRSPKEEATDKLEVSTFNPTATARSLRSSSIAGNRRLGAFLMSTAAHPVCELLAPAGDWEALRAAAANGADAVYFGLAEFNARHRAHNFTTEELPEVVDYLHRHNVRGYVTVN